MAESHIHLIGLNFCGFIFCSLWLFFFKQRAPFLYFHQNDMEFWPLTLSLSVELVDILYKETLAMKGDRFQFQNLT